MHFTAYALPAIVSLLAKAGLFFYARHSRVQNLKTKLYLWFLFSLAIQNLVEINLFHLRSAGVPDPAGGTLYFSASVAAIAFLLHLSLAMAVNWHNTKNNNVPDIGLVLIYAPALVLEALLWSGPLLVAGLEPASYTYTKIPGPLYFLFEVYAFSYLAGAVCLFTYGAYAQATAFRRLQNKLFLTGLFPIVLLVTIIIALQRFGFHWFNTTTTLPIAVTFFLAVTAYATHQYRLFDIDFFIPWSKIRKRKTEFYKRIQATIGAIAELRSVREVTQLIAETLHCQLALVGGRHTVTALAKGQHPNKDLRLLSRFPLDALKTVDHIVVAQEIADSDPALHRTMEAYRVGAIVPFRSHSRVASRWLILGDHFSNEVYTPLDFQIVEGLFAAMAERFLDDFLEVRSQLANVQEQLRRTTFSLGTAWHKEDDAKRALDVIRSENRELRDEIARLQRDALKTEEPEAPGALAKDEMTLEEYLSACEREAVISALERYGASKPEAAKALGVTLRMLEYLLERHGISEETWTIQ